MKKLLCAGLLLMSFCTYSMEEKSKTVTTVKMNYEERGILFKKCLKAIENNDIDFIQSNWMYIKNNLQDYYCDDMLSLPIIAVKKRKNQIAKMLLLAGMDINGSSGYHILLYAMKNKDTDMLQYLLNSGANPYQLMGLFDNRKNSFHVAIKKNKLDYIKRFIEADKQQKFEKFRGFRGILEYALLKNKEDIAQYLIESDEEGNSINEECAGGFSLLQVAYQSGLYNTAGCLLENGVDVNFQRNKKISKETALHEAAKENSLLIINELIQNGANPSIKNQEKLPEDVATGPCAHLLKRARSIQTWCENFNEKKLTSKDIKNLSVSFPLLCFALHNLHSPEVFSKLYSIIIDNKEFHEDVASMLTIKERFKSEFDFREALLENINVRLKAHFYNSSLISKYECINKFGEEQFEKMVITANRIKSYTAKN